MARFMDRQRLSREKRDRPVTRDLGFLEQKASLSRPGQVYHEMMTRQGQADPDLDRLKSLRSDWNRNLKYTPSGMTAAGASTPQGAMDRFRTTTEDFRQANKPAYNRMYPISGMGMDYPEKGGLTGMFLKGALGGLGKNIIDFGKKGYEGISSALSGDSEEDKERYITETFGPHLEGVPYGGPPPYSDVYEGPRPHEDFPIVYPQDTPINWDLENNKYYQDLNQSEIDYLMGRTDEIADEDMNIPDEPLPLDEPTGRTLADVIDEPLPFDDSPRETGIMNAMRAPYTREDDSLRFPPQGPHDPFDPDQREFEDREEYDAWLRRQRLGY